LRIDSKLTTIFPEAKQKQGIVSIRLYNAQIDHRLSNIDQHHQQKPKTSVTAGRKTNGTLQYLK